MATLPSLISSRNLLGRWSGLPHEPYAFQRQRLPRDAIDDTRHCTEPYLATAVIAAQNQLGQPAISDACYFVGSDRPNRFVYDGESAQENFTQLYSLPSFNSSGCKCSLTAAKLRAGISGRECC